ncbi:DUF547 domain-containing protein [Flavobacterium sp. SUN052]|uniref:DUF547 domain-containing protein n=1 Tax=Flavobacterium sp. SUN052 TaxID=3002441 RepID=UPI00237E43B3|nr:DUF547 domain-containing protein [Flavobacterium sp. SUN052]MEC4004366.1 DUF547 domain-containing protein [Flavobacterium sp. SUN052]
MKYLFILLFLSYSCWSQSTDYIKISQKFIESAKLEGDSTAYFIDVLANANETELLSQLQTDDLKKAFFINLYNAYTNYALKKNPEKYKSRNSFFKSKQFIIAGNKLSLDIIEHGFLRKSSIKWSLGKFKKIFPSKIEKKFRVEKVDYRIHFSLNCGAKSCPPIFFYDPKTLDKQLDIATKNYLTGDASYDKEKNELSLPVLMSWFRGDFGNKKGILKICSDLKIIPENVLPKLKYNKYDWSLYLENFKY